MKIGLPTALLDSFYLTFWQTFFQKLDLEVLRSGKTNKQILDKGIQYSVAEICAPMKIYTGHIVDLIDQGVDFVYIPRMISIRKNDSFCPKFIGLPDMLKCTVPSIEEKMLTHSISSKNDDIGTLQNFMDIGLRFTDQKSKVKEAIEAARAKWFEFRHLCLQGYNCNQANDIVLHGKKISPYSSDIRIGILGYVYNIYDHFLSMDILEKMEQLGVNYTTFEMLSDRELHRQLKKLNKDLFWTFSNKLIAAGYSFLDDPEIDGVIHVTAFGCGPDSFLGKMLELDSTAYEKPFMTIRVDEHTGENHLQTRIEAFVDMLVRKKHRKEDAV